MKDKRALFWNSLEPEHLRARGFCRKLAGNREDGDDLYQDSLVRALTGFERLKEIRHFRPWLYRIIINRFKSRCRIGQVRRWLPLTGSGLYEPATPDPENAYAARRRIKIALAALKPTDRVLVTLYELQGWRMAELSEVTGKSEGSLKVRLTRARAKMRRALIEYLDGGNSNVLKSVKTSEDRICVVTKPGKK